MSFPDLVNAALGLLGVYVLIGVVFAAVFLVVGIGAVDPVVRDSPKRTRVLLAPGCVALWPVLAIKWLGVKKQKEPV
ncbi:MAG: hypothetical protein AAGI30_10855 [Planctomycetota bacterium]